MKQSVLYGIFGIVCFVLVVIKCTPLTSDSSENIEDASVELFSPNGIPSAELGKECQIGLKIRLSRHIDSIEISSSCNEYNQAFPLISEKMYDTLYFTPVFETEGYCTLYVRAPLNSEREDLNNHLVVQVWPDTFLNFSTTPEPFTTHTGATDTLLFTLDHFSNVAYTLSCSPILDSTELHFVDSTDNGTSRVHFDPDQPGSYTVSLFAEVETHSDVASVDITVLPSFTPLSVEQADTIVTGIIDTVIYMLSPEQIAQGMTMWVLASEDILCGTIGVVPVGNDSLLIMVSSPIEGELTFSIVTSTETFGDTVTRTITFIDENSAGPDKVSITAPAQTIERTKENGSNFSTGISELPEGTQTNVVITTTGRSTKTNNRARTIDLTLDPTMQNTDVPVFIKIDGTENGGRITELNS